jgi:hypothetical protein
VTRQGLTGVDHGRIGQAWPSCSKGSGELPVHDDAGPVALYVGTAVDLLPAQ